VTAWPVDNVDEIPNEAPVEEPVIEIAAYARCKQSQGNENNFTFGPGKEKDRQDNHNRSDRHHYKLPPVPCGHSEGSAGIFSELEFQEAIDNGEAIMPLVCEPVEHGIFTP